MKSFDEIKQYLEYVLLGKPGTKAISQASTSAYLWPFVEEVEKAVKALEIIKDKQVDIHNLLNSKTCKQFNNFTKWLGYKGNLTQEEYDLLKEVLL